MREPLQRGVAENHRLHAAEHRRKRDAERDQQERRRPRLLAHRRRDDEELAREDAERRHAEDRQRPEHQPPADHRRDFDQATDLVHDLCAGLLRRMADGEEDRGLDQRMHRHVQEPRVVGDRPAETERKGHQPHVLDRRVGEHALHVLLTRQQEGRGHDRQQPEAHHHLAGERAVQRAVGEHLAAQDRVQRDVEQQPRQHGRHGRRALGMGVGQPVVDRHEAHLGDIADEQEREGERDDARVEQALDRVEVGTQQRCALGAGHLLGGHVQQHRAEQRLRDADAAEDEVFPRRFQARRGAVDADQQHGGQGRRLHRHPQDAHVVGHERQQHREAEQLVHAVVQAQPGRRHLAVVALDAHVGAREQRRRQADEGRQRDQENVQCVDEELVFPREQRPAGDDLNGEHAGRDERAEAEQGVEIHRPVAVTDERQHQAAAKRNPEHEIERLQAHSSRSFSRWRMSRLSNFSRIWNMNTPRISTPISTSSAMPSSTTIGMP